MKVIAIGSNLPQPPFATPKEVCEAALDRFSEHGLTIVKCSAWYDSSPVPPSNQPRFVNGAVAIETDLSPKDTLESCLEIEREFGRIRTQRWSARTLDLDVIAWDNIRIELPHLTVPHPEMERRAFVLLPLADIAPNWHHPITKTPIDRLISLLPEGEAPQRLQDQSLQKAARHT